MIRNKKVAFVKLTDIWFDTEYYLSSKDKIVSLHTNDVLEKTKYDFRVVRKTFLLDIEREEKDIFSGLDQKSCRYPINKAGRDGVHVWKAENSEDRQKYIDFQNAFCSGKGIPCVNEKELKDLDIFCAESKEGEFLGGCAFIVSTDGQTARYKYGATAHKLNANEAILWNAICEYNKLGYKWFDLGGCVPTEDKESYYYRHFHFKKKWGGELIDSYTYFRIKGFYRLFYFIFDLFVKLFFKGDVNGFTVWLNKKGLIK